jgi:hypothetical protein
MTTALGIANYVLGTAFLLLGTNAVVNPKDEYARFGLPLEPRTSSSSEKPANRYRPGEDGGVSSWIYLKAIREASYGLTLIGLQYTGNEEGLNVVLAVTSAVALGDGFLVRACGGKYRHKMFAHWGASVFLAGLVWWRMRVL